MCDFSLKELCKQVGEVVQEKLEVVLHRELAAMQAAIKADFQDGQNKSLQAMRKHLDSRRKSHAQDFGPTYSRGSKNSSRARSPKQQHLAVNHPHSFVFNLNPGRPQTAMSNSSQSRLQNPPRDTSKRVSLNSINENENLFRRKSLGGALLDATLGFRREKPQGLSLPVAEEGSPLKGNPAGFRFSNGSADPGSKAPSGAPPKLHLPSGNEDHQDFDRSPAGSRNGSKNFQHSLIAVETFSEEDESKRASWMSADSDIPVLDKDMKPKKDSITGGFAPSSNSNNSWDVESIQNENGNDSTSRTASPDFSEASMNYEQVKSEDGSVTKGNEEQYALDEIVLPTVLPDAPAPPPEKANQDDGKDLLTRSIELWDGSWATQIFKKPPRNSLQGKAQAIISSSWFDFLATSMVILNSILIGLQTDWQIHHINEPVAMEYRYCEMVFACIFTAELSMRIAAYGCSFLCVPEWRWNLFDTLIVCLQLVEEAAALITDTSKMPSNFNFVRILRILRLVRIMRLVRLLRFIQELRTMVCSIANCLKSLFWTLVLLFLMIYVMSVYITQMIADHGVPSILEGEAPLAMYYSSLARAVLSLFQGMTGGVDWDDLISPLMEEISPLTGIVFSLYIAFAVLAMMNVVTGIFVESALLTAKADKEAEIQSHVRKIFKKGDVNHDGMISWEEFTDAMSDPSLGKYFKVLDIDVNEARGLFLLLDTDESGQIDTEEFVMGILRLRGAARAIDLATLMYFNKRMMHWWTEWRDDVDHDLTDIMAILTEGDDLPGVEDEIEKEDNSFVPMISDNNSESSKSTEVEKRSRRSTRRNLKRQSYSQKNQNMHFATWADLNREAEHKAEKAEIEKQGSMKMGSRTSLKVPSEKKSVKFGIPGFLHSPRASTGRLSVAQKLGDAVFGPRGSNCSQNPMTPVTPVDTQDAGVASDAEKDREEIEIVDLPGTSNN